MESIYLIKNQMVRSVRNTSRNIQFLVLPVLMILIIGYLTSNYFSSSITSYQFYSGSVLIFMYLGYGINSSFAFIEPRNKSGNLRLLYMPLNEKWIYLSHVISETIFGCFTVIVNMVVIQFIFDVEFKDFIIVFFMLSSIVLLSNSIGILLSLIVDNAIVIEEIFTIAQLILCIMGGVFFSIESISDIPTIIAYLSPVKWIMEGLNQSIYNNSSSALIGIIIGSILLSVIVVRICRRKFKVENYA